MVQKSVENRKARVAARVEEKGHRASEALVVDSLPVVAAVAARRARPYYQGSIVYYLTMR